MSDGAAKGFQLRELRLCGPGLPDATLEFTDGLNVIEGASDTGKSYAVSCIDFVLGAKDPPEEIPHASGYTVAYLHIEAATGEHYALKRALAGGKIGLYHGRLDDALEDAQAVWDPLSIQNDAAKSVSKFLLGLCGLAGKRVRKNDSGTTQEVSFRVLAKALIVDEERVIAKRSPIYGTQNITNTAAASTLRLLLTGHDDSDIVQPEDQKTAAGRHAGQRQAIESLLSKDEELLEDLTGGEDRASVDAMQAMDDMLRQLSASASSALETLQAEESRRRALWADLRGGRERVSELQGLLARAQILDQHYQSDLARLSAIVESAHVLRHYTEEPCQFCGADPEHQQHDHGQSPEAMIEAARAEAAKVRRLQLELRSARQQMEAEQAEIDILNAERNAKLEEASRRIDGELSPRMKEATEALRTFQSEYATHVRARELKNRIVTLRQQLAELGEKPEKREKLEFIELTATTMADVCTQIASLLNDWNAVDQPSVVFDESNVDLLINGRKRTSHGKGVRAVMCAAYVIGLMQRTVQTQAGHPGFVVIDTPLNPYKAADVTDDGAVATSVKDSFYRNLCSTDGLGQVIVFENTTPPEDVQGDCNYVHFSGSAVGRRGFIPTRTPSP